MESTYHVKDVFTISERDGGTADGGKERWTKIGVAFVNRDDSLNIILDANPINGRLHVRERRLPKRTTEQHT